MARAYKKTYLSSAMRNLAVMMDCGVRKYGYSIEEFYNKFLASDVSRQFASGNPRYLVGMSGAELADCVVEVSGGTVLNENNGTYTVGPEYWAGWALAYYQWLSCRSFTYMLWWLCIIPSTKPTSPSSPMLPMPSLKKQARKSESLP